MKIIVAHNFYQQPGGEDQVFADETALLESRGHSVVRYTVHNDAINHLNGLTVAGRTIWNNSARHELHELAKKERADVVHFHNTFPMLSPAVYVAARSAGAAVVQTLHNYRLMCPAAIFFRDGHVCEDCQGRAVPWPGVMHKCYRDSYAASAVSATMLAFHRARGTYRNDVDAYIALTEFARGKFVEAGLPPEKIIVKPNFVYPDPGIGAGGGGYALFVGRLSESKGLAALLDAWKKITAPIQLKIMGDGELAQSVKDAAASDSRIEWLGRRPLNEVYHRMGEAVALIFPSVWYEGLPKTIIESFAKGTPVIASRLGSMAELVADGRTGALFTPGDSDALAASVQQLLANPTQLQFLRVEARKEFESRYTADQNAQMLSAVYNTALRRDEAGSEILRRTASPAIDHRKSPASADKFYMTRAAVLNPPAAPSTNRRRRNRLTAEIPGWILPANGHPYKHAPSDEEAWEIRIQNVSRYGIGFISTEHLRIGEQQRIRIGRGPMKRAKTVRIVACRESENNAYVIGAEFVDTNGIG